MPVLVWIHGGFFKHGDASKTIYGPKLLVKQNVILVTVNYRLGPYGFMCLDTPEVPGNQGMKDQLTALRWVRDNIGAFGGDVNKITLFGESAGGISVDLHLYSIQEKIFNNVIIQSGSAVAATVITEADKLAPIKMAEQLDFVTDSVDDALTFLTNADPNLVIAAATATNILFKPCAEREFDDIEHFITTPWINAPIPKVKDMSILIGFNSHERLTDYMDKGSDYFINLNVIRGLLTQTFVFDEDKLQNMEDIIHHYYFGDETISEDLKYAIGDFDSDYTYIHPVQRSIKKYLKNSVQNVYHYMFAYSGGRNLIQSNRNFTINGAVHADELGYLYDAYYFTEDPSPEDQTVVDQMTTMWANFAKYR